MFSAAQCQYWDKTTKEKGNRSLKIVLLTQLLLGLLNCNGRSGALPTEVENILISQLNLNVSDRDKHPILTPGEVVSVEM